CTRLPCTLAHCHYTTLFRSPFDDRAASRRRAGARENARGPAQPALRKEGSRREFGAAPAARRTHAAIRAEAAQSRLPELHRAALDRKSTRLNSSHQIISYAV